MNTRATAVAELERRIGYIFTDRDLLERALTHASVGDRSPKLRHNQRLEFLGDRVLNLVIAEELMGRMPDVDEGVLTKAYHKLVNIQACAAAAARMGLGEALRLGGGTAKLGLRRNERVVGDACEALIAALYLDGGLAVAKDCILALWTDNFSGLDAPENKDPKTMLQEWALGRGLPVPRYVVVRQEGSAHKPSFTMAVEVQGFEPQTASGGSKREAEKLAAMAMLNKHAGAS